MSTVRARAADRMALEIHQYLASVLPAGIGAREDVWDRVAAADDAMMGAVIAWERGEIGYDELEAEGVRYVEAWQGIAAAPPEEAAA